MSIIRKDRTCIVTDKLLSKNGNTLVIVLAGFCYTLNHPLLYYVKNTVNELKCDYLGIDFDYKNNPFFLQKLENDKDVYFEEDNVLIKEYIKDISKAYQKVVFIGKSMGTSIIKRLIDDIELLNKSTLVLMTPGTEWSSIIKKIVTIKNNILVIGSLADKNYRVEGLEEIYTMKNIKVLELNDTNHALETGSVDQDLKILNRVISTIKKFING